MVALALTAVMLSGSLVAAPLPAPLRFQVSVKYQAEKKGDGAPTLHFRYRLTNLGATPLWLSWWWRPVDFEKVGPSRLFSVRKTTPHPHRLAPPGPDDLFVIEPGKTVEKVDWMWVGGFVIDHGDGTMHEYRLRQPGRISLTPCYASGGLDEHDLQRLLPAGTALWTGRICAPPVSVEIPALPSQRL
jgi:hypothetical protein